MARKSDGWVKIHYGILKEDLTPSQFKFFVGSILLANPPTAKDPGLVDLSARQIAEELGMSHVEVWRKEQELAKQDMITILSKGFQINKYAYYQGDTSVTHTKQQSPPQSVTPTKQGVTNMKQGVTPTKQSVTNLVPEEPPKKEEVLRSIKKKKGANAPNLLAQTEASKYLFSKTGRKRWQNLVQKEQFEKAESEVGEAQMKEAIDWALTSGISNVKSIITAARKSKHGEPAKRSPESIRRRETGTTGRRDKEPTPEEYIRSLPRTRRPGK